MAETLDVLNAAVPAPRLSTGRTDEEQRPPTPRSHEPALAGGRKWHVRPLRSGTVAA